MPEHSCHTHTTPTPAPTITPIYHQTMSVQKIRLPSVNDIFPQQHHHAQQLNYPPNHSPITHTQQTRELIGMAQSMASSTPSRHRPPSPLAQQQMMTAHYTTEPQHSMPVYYYQPVYYTHTPGTSPPPPQMPSYTHPTTSPVASPLYAPHQSMTYPPQMYMNVDHLSKYRVQKQRQSNAWTDEDDTLLKYLKEVRNLGWREISMHFRNRTANGCQFRWRRISALAKSLKGKSESDSEDSEKEEEEKGRKRENSLDKLLN